MSNFKFKAALGVGDDEQIALISRFQFQIQSDRNSNAKT